jgi:hypothetical protein
MDDPEYWNAWGWIEPDELSQDLDIAAHTQRLSADVVTGWRAEEEGHCRKVGVRDHAAQRDLAEVPACHLVAES